MLELLRLTFPGVAVTEPPPPLVPGRLTVIATEPAADVKLMVADPEADRRTCCKLSVAGVVPGTEVVLKAGLPLPVISSQWASPAL